MKRRQLQFLGEDSQLDFTWTRSFITALPIKSDNLHFPSGPRLSITMGPPLSPGNNSLFWSELGMWLSTLTGIYFVIDISGTDLGISDVNWRKESMLKRSKDSLMDKYTDKSSKFLPFLNWENFSLHSSLVVTWISPCSKTLEVGPLKLVAPHPVMKTPDPRSWKI